MGYFLEWISDSDDGNNVGPDRKQMAWDEKDFWMVLYGRKKCQRGCFIALGCLIVDMGHYHSPIIKCRISIWDKCTIVGGKYNVYIYIWRYFCSW